MSMDIKIIVVTHKPYWMPSDDVYIPLHVGKALHPCLNLGIQTDDAGDNVSDKNASYCELTGLYWAWENLKADYIGLCHYRRYFANSAYIFSRDAEKKKRAILARQDYEEMLSKYDIIVPTKRHYFIETVRSQYEHAHYKKDLDAAEQIMREKRPDYIASFDKVMRQRSLHILNMFVMKWPLFDEYCAWLFPMLFELEKRIDTSGYDVYERRVYGFIAERLFNVWLENQHARVKEMPVMCLENVDWTHKIISFLERKFLGTNNR